MAEFLLALILLFPLSSSAQNTPAGTVPLGASLTADGTSDPWRSPNGDFAFGFRQLPDNDDLFILSIWFDKIPNKTLAWYERTSFPVPRRSTVVLDAANGIVLRNPQGTVLFQSNAVNGGVAGGYMNDTGNFVLRRSDSATVWESFDNPTDTILPGQIIPIGGDLTSPATATNFSQGRFYARMISDGNFVLSVKSFPSGTEFDDDYYNTPTSDTSRSNSGVQVVFSDDASLAVVGPNGTSLFKLTSNLIPSAADNYYRVTLDFDGILTQYYHPRNFTGAPAWGTADSWPGNICTGIKAGTGSGACGYNSICKMENRRPVCQCPPQFSLADPTNAYGDCLPNYDQFCVAGDRQSSPENYEMSNISDVDWPFNDYFSLKPSTADQCYSLCLSDCFCGAAIFRSNQCWKKRLPLSNGAVDTSLGATAFLKVKKGDNPNRPSSDRTKTKDRGTLILVGSILLGSSAFINVLLIAAVFLGLFLIYKRKSKTSVRAAPRSNLYCFTYKDLFDATTGFAKEVGRGAFGIVYKGEMIVNDSKTMVAVKKLNQASHDSEKEFKTEVDVIGLTHHKNLVQLIGFCNEGPNRLLVYEYMSNGALSSFLFGESKPGWIQRSNIALGVARGLTYLHEECATQIIHCDIKPQNILLDDNYNARISDFGLAKLLMMDQSRTTTNIRGTRGYVAPEWYRNIPVTVKVDVYSFGVLLLEIVTCRKSVYPNMEFSDAENVILIDWVVDCFTERAIGTLVGDEEEAMNDGGGERVERFVMVAIWCVQEDASLRPTMKEACLMLEGAMAVEVPPCPYPIFSATTSVV
ncbi:G-type lectin S-receptor-like serine/threonine-protein kinase LECRK2 [Andrographis paniculata]|uniref:G-type lectin S-receptor-like serine/threonine-protein kinase LECRK2 n=1 Tax=Andrographis paniculata TaxID=175694 RepID=UPI0021E85F34|nr:G-type lectin S-receptor-like serine/threonine-protein kinase LECRK2 [Andrographis paniculata]